MASFIAVGSLMLTILILSEVKPKAVRLGGDELGKSKEVGRRGGVGMGVGE